MASRRKEAHPEKVQRWLKNMRRYGMRRRRNTLANTNVRRGDLDDKATRNNPGLRHCRRIPIYATMVQAIQIYYSLDNYRIDLYAISATDDLQMPRNHAIQYYSTSSAAAVVVASRHLNQACHATSYQRDQIIQVALALREH